MFLFLLFLRGIAPLPRQSYKPLAALLGLLLFVFAWERHRVGDQNLRIAFPESGFFARKMRLLAHLYVFVLSFLDHAWLWFGTGKQLHDYVEIAGQEHIPADRLSLWLAPHFVGLNIGGTRMAQAKSIVAIYVTQKNPTLDAVIRRSRERYYMPRLLSRQDGVRPLIKAFKEGFQVHYSPDLDVGSKDALFVDFFGEPAATVTALPRLAGVTGAVIVPMLTFMTARGYRIQFYPAWENYPSGDVAADLRRMNTFLETEIRAHPSQYFWLHKRYKTRPEGRPKLY